MLTKGESYKKSNYCEKRIQLYDFNDDGFIF